MHGAVGNTVEPRLTNTLVRRTPLLDGHFYPVPFVFHYITCLKTSRVNEHPTFPVGRTIPLVPEPFAHGVMCLIDPLCSSFPVEIYTQTVNATLKSPCMATGWRRQIKEKVTKLDVLCLVELRHRMRREVQTHNTF